MQKLHVEGLKLIPRRRSLCADARAHRSCMRRELIFDNACLDEWLGSSKIGERGLYGMQERLGNTVRRSIAVVVILKVEPGEVEVRMKFSLESMEVLRPWDRVQCFEMMDFVRPGTYQTLSSLWVVGVRFGDSSEIVWRRTIPFPVA